MVLPDRYVSPELLRINPKCQWPENLEAPSGVQGLRCWTAGVLNIMHPHRNEIALDAKLKWCATHIISLHAGPWHTFMNLRVADGRICVEVPRFHMSLSLGICTGPARNWNIV